MLRITSGLQDSTDDSPEVVWGLGFRDPKTLKP